MVLISQTDCADIATDDKHFSCQWKMNLTAVAIYFGTI